MKKLFSSIPSGVTELKLIKVFLSCLGLIGLTGMAYGLDNYLLVIDNGAANTCTAGGTLQVTIMGRQGVSKDGSYTGTATISVTPNPGTISTENGTATLHFTNGDCSEKHLRFKAAGTNNITISNGTVSTSVSTVVVSPGLVDHLILLRHSSEITESLTPGIAPGWNYHGVTLSAGVPVALSVAAVDQYYNPCTGTTMNFTIQIASDPYYSQAASIDAATGIATFPTWVPSSLTGSGEAYTFSLSSSPTYLASQTNRYNWVFAPNNAYMWTDVPTTVVAGIPFLLTVTATTLNTRTSPNVTWVNNAFTLNPRLADGTGANGHAALDPSLTTLMSGISTLMCTYTIAERIRIVPIIADAVSGKTFTEGGYQVFNVVAAAPAAPLTINVSPSNLQAQKTALISVTVHDRFNNLVPGITVGFEKVSGAGDSSLNATSAQTGLDGVATVSFKGGIVNEIALVRVTAGSVVQDQKINISVAPPSGGDMINYPNPFNPLSQKTSINYYLKADSEVEIKIYDAFGRMVLSKKISAGQGSGDYATATLSGGASFLWDGCNGEGQKVGNGIYVVKVTARNSVEVQNFTRRVGVLK